MKKMKNLVVISHKRHDKNLDDALVVQGGFVKITSEFARHVERLTLCVPVGVQPDTLAIAEYPENIELKPLPMYGGHIGFILRLPVIMWILWREIGKADVVYSMAPNNMGVLGLVLARMHRKPVFLSIDTDRAGKAQLAGGFRGVVKAWFVEKIIHTLLRRLGGKRPAYVTGDAFLGSHPHWRQWIKTTVTSSEVPDYSDTRPGGLLQVIFVGRLSKEKNIGCLIAAVSFLQNEGFPVALQIVGHGRERAALEAYVESCGVECVTFRGAVPNDELRKTHFLGSDVLVLPSKEERQGKVLLEAMACSVPVIAARAGGVPSVITSEFNGLLFNPDDPNELAQCIRELNSNTSLRNHIAKNGYRFALENTLDQSVAEIVRDVSAFYDFV